MQARAKPPLLCYGVTEQQGPTSYIAACAAIPVCIGVAVYDLANAHEHEAGVQYPYMHIRTKDYPWGNCTLFDKHCWAEQRGEGGEH